MSHFEDDEPPIKTRAASKEYRDNFDRIFGEKRPGAEMLEALKLRCSVVFEGVYPPHGADETCAGCERPLDAYDHCPDL